MDPAKMKEAIFEIVWSHFYCGDGVVKVRD